jgi:hypothetical protein
MFFFENSTVQGSNLLVNEKKASPWQGLLHLWHVTEARSKLLKPLWELKALGGLIDWEVFPTTANHIPATCMWCETADVTSDFMACDIMMTHRLYRLYM